MQTKLVLTTVLIIFLNVFAVGNNTKRGSLNVINPNDSITKYNELSIKAYRAGELDKFKSYATKAYLIADEHGLHEVKIKSLVHLAIYYQQTDKYEESLVKYIEAEKLTEGLSEKSYLKVMVNTNLGNLYNAIGNFDKAKKSMKRVLELADYHENKNDIKVVAINAIGTAELNQKNYSESLTYFYQLKELVDQMDRNDLLIRAYINISDCNRNMGNHLKAIENYKEALARIDEKESLETKALVHFGLGTSYFQLKKPKQALPFLNDAKNFAASGDFLKIKMETHEQLVKVYESLKNIDKAFEEQKEYTTTRELYLNSLSKAQRLQLEKETAEKTEEISLLSKLKNTYGIIGIVLAILLIGFVLSYKAKKKQFVKSASQLLLDKEFLEDENAKLKDRLNAFAIRLKQNKTQLGEGSSEKTEKKSSISSEEQEAFREQILNYMEEKQPYLDQEVKQADIASELNMSIHQLSEYLNICFKQNFNSFINIYRVEKVKEYIKTPKYADYKIIAIGYEAGFSSKTSFNRVFKNIVGCTPSEYQRNNKPDRSIV